MPGNAILGWLGPLLVAVFAGLLRFDRLHIPGKIIFDETYYAKDAWSLLRFGAEHSTVENADKLIEQGRTTGIFTDGGSFVVHPPVGKWMIAAGEQLFGLTPFGWRFSAALIGALSVLIIARLARRMTRSTLLGCIAGLLLALDGLHFVLSRTALLDVFLMFWVLAAFACLVVDRDRSRAKLVRIMETRTVTGRGPWLGTRWWRIAAGICLGLAVGTKWNALFFVAAFGLLTVTWDYGARRAAGLRSANSGWFLLDALPAFASTVVLGAVTYLASWAGWFASAIGEHRHWADAKPSGFSFVPESLRSLWHYHAEILRFHSDLSQSHPYQSQPWQWMLDLRPVAFFYSSPKSGEIGCTAPQCAREVLGLGTPAIWWGALIALAVLVWWWLITRDWRAGAVLLGVAAGWLPWFLFLDRTKFFFYTAPYLPFLVLALTLALGLLIGPSDGRPVRRAAGASITGAYLLVVILNFLYLYPVLAAKVIPQAEWGARIWFKSWV
ncbi:MAG: phospholipid carrier-dependent glycosyltransferase [Streptosporangiales bacterium]|nr:phospholipid carrier-dependent glycosyltransferase [Streptosporangiales bacterium]